jgi:hypothetical protein
VALAYIDYLSDNLWSIHIKHISNMTKYIQFLFRFLESRYIFQHFNCADCIISLNVHFYQNVGWCFPRHWCTVGISLGLDVTWIGAEGQANKLHTISMGSQSVANQLEETQFIEQLWTDTFTVKQSWIRDSQQGDCSPTLSTTRHGLVYTFWQSIPDENCPIIYAYWFIMCDQLGFHPISARFEWEYSKISIKKRCSFFHQ